MEPGQSCLNSTWLDLVEHQTDNATNSSEEKNPVGFVVLGICILTILANLFLFGLILCSKELRKQRCNLFMISIGSSDIANVLFLLIFNRPGLSKGRYIEAVSSSAGACQAHNILGCLLIAASWYNFCGQFVYLYLMP
jgi:hypothetical protein